MEVQESLEQA
jgi:hypothetical protein